MHIGGSAVTATLPSKTLVLTQLMYNRMTKKIISLNLMTKINLFLLQLNEYCEKVRLK